MNKIFYLAVVIIIVASACRHTDKKSDNENSIDLEALRRDTMAQVKKDTLPVAPAVVINEDSVAIQVSNNILHAIRDKDYSKLAQYIDPEKGVAFYPYSYIDNENKNKNHFTKESFLQQAHSSDKRNWGAADGSGEPIHLSVKEYLNKFVYEADYLKSNNVAANKSLFKKSNGIDNSRNMYKDMFFVDYLKKPVAGEHEFDWSNLRFIFNKRDGQLYLVAVVRNVWQI